MKLKEKSIEWAISHLRKENDTDILPKSFEIDIINENKEYCISELSKLDINAYKWNLPRRFVIPKDELSFRVITQLDPLDSVFFSAIIYEYGHLIESKRIHETENVVFGSRFNPTADGYLYKTDGQWRKFWKTVQEKASKFKFMLRFDIADFYNQIYHHSIENELEQCEFPNEVQKSIKKFLNTMTLKMSRGIPVGPHSTHLIAEAALIQIDNSLKSKGIKYCRYMDDFVAFCESELECRILLNQIATILDKQGRLILQRHKTKIFYCDDFIAECTNQLNYEPLNDTEGRILEIVKEHLEDGPYTKNIKWADLDEDDKEYFSKLYYDNIISGYLNENPNPNFPKLKWLYRRLSQLGVPFAINYTIEHLLELTPIINDVCEYFVSAAPNYTDSLPPIGKKLHSLLDSDLIKSNEYFQIALINLFSKNQDLNHFEIFARNFQSYSEPVKRKILLVAKSSNAVALIRENKEKYNDFSIWTKRAFLYSCSSLPRDERKFFYETALSYLNDNIVEKSIIKWGKAK